MSTTTALILVGRSHPNHSGIIPSHHIRLTENSRPALILQSLDETDSEPIILIPSVENTIDDIYLMISTYILKLVHPSVELHTKELISIYDLVDSVERHDLYTSSKKCLQAIDMKVVFNILEHSMLLDQIQRIPKYPIDFEVTTPLMKKEYDRWTNKTELRMLK
jgi:hypothetical protein